MSSDETQDAFASLGARLDPATVTVVGPYKNVRYFAAGGMAWLYEGRHPQFPEKRVAVKLMKPEYAAMPAMRERFLREAQLLARVGHPHLVSVHSFGVDEASRCPYFGMDYIDGGTLAERLEADGALTLAAAGELFDRMLGALGALHREGVIHRDIKPSNILLWRSGEPMLADLGIARDTSATGASTTQHYIGSPKYSSPEQAHGLRLDPRTDVFSLGLSLFEALVGYHPYEDAKDVDTSSAASLIGLLAVLYRDKKPIPLEFPREVPKSVRAVVRKACEIQPEKRFSDAEEMRRALRAAIRSTEDAAQDGASGTGTTLLGHGRRVVLGIGALALVVALAVAGYAGWAAHEREQARAELAQARRATTAIAPDDAALGERLSEASAAIDRDEPAAAVAIASEVCGQLGSRAGESVTGSLADSAAALQGRQFAVRHSGVGASAWQALDTLAKDGARAAPAAASEDACASSLRLAGYAAELREANDALGAALSGPEFRTRVDDLRKRSHSAELAPLIDSDALASADAAFAAKDLPKAFGLYMHAELTARAGQLAQRFAPTLRQVAAAPEFEERHQAASSALTRIVKLGTLADFETLAAELEPAEKDATNVLEAVRGDVAAALAAGDQALVRAQESGVARAALARGRTQLDGARAAAEQERLVAAMTAAKSAQAELEQLAKVVTEGAGVARGARESALAKRLAATESGAPERALAKGDALVERADALVGQGEPARAVDGFAGAEKEFEAARGAAAAASTRAAEGLRDAATAARQKAVELGASEADLTEGSQAQALAEQALESGRPRDAQQQFTAARDAFRRAPLRPADERAARAREAAVAAGAIPEALAKGDTSLGHARAAEAPADALKAFTVAERAFERAGGEAARSGALAKRQLALGAQGRAVRAQAVEADLRAGRAALDEGDAALAKGDATSAAERFAAATALFAEAENTARSRLEQPAAP